MSRFLVVLLAAAAMHPGLSHSFCSADEAHAGKLSIEVSSADGHLLPCRIHLSDAAGKPQRAPGLPFWRDHFVCDGQAALDLAPGTYRYEIERGPEHERLTGTVEISADQGTAIARTLNRLTDLAEQGWYSGDLHVHRPLADIPLLMQAEDLHIAPVITWWNKQNPWKERELPERLLERAGENRFYHILAGEDERGGGALLYFHLPQPLEITAAGREHPSSLAYLEMARRANPHVWVDIEKPFWWDVPAWAVSGQVDSIGIANNHMCRSQMYPDEAWGRPRDVERLPDPLGNGFWTQEIYYHLLNCGLRLPPSAGSASGVLPNPLGYNRVYVQVDQPLEYDSWWRNLKAGRSFVTNGPLLVCRANGELPGHVFAATGDEPLDIEISAHLISLDRIPKLEIVHNGEVVQTIGVRDARDQTLTAQLRCADSGWFLVRAIADNARTFRFASTAPFYLEIGRRKQRVSMASVRFFLDWLDERIAGVETALADPGERRDVLRYLDSARVSWREKLAEATAP